MLQLLQSLHYSFSLTPKTNVLTENRANQSLNKLQVKVKTYSKSELAALYSVHVNTFHKWIKEIPSLILSKYQRKLTPKQVMIIINHLGEP